jgi:hypothetical protein
MRYEMDPAKGRNTHIAVNFSGVRLSLRGTFPERAWSIALEGGLVPSATHVKQGIAGIYVMTLGEVRVSLWYAVGVPLDGAEATYHFAF